MAKPRPVGRRIVARPACSRSRPIWIGSLVSTLLRNRFADSSLRSERAFTARRKPLPAECHKVSSERLTPGHVRLHMQALGDERHLSSNLSLLIRSAGSPAPGARECRPALTTGPDLRPGSGYIAHHWHTRGSSTTIWGGQAYCSPSCFAVSWCWSAGPWVMMTRRRRVIRGSWREKRKASTVPTPASSE
jgi:hypothetical protein